MNRSHPVPISRPPLHGAPRTRGAAAAAALWLAIAVPAVAAPAPRAAAPSAIAAADAVAVATAPRHRTAQAGPTECVNCGVVERVQPVRQKGRATGLGAVTGGVLGGVVGHQFGGGTGRSAMTALGAVGGGIAGHEVEKRYRAKTVYAVRIRMDDGSVRTLTREHPPARGTRVAVDGQRLRVIGTARGPSAKPAPRHAGLERSERDATAAA